jgi:hypothetical protein
VVLFVKDLCPCWVLVTHACNPTYSGGRDQEDRGLKPDRANSFARPYLEKNPLKKKKKKKGW